MAFLNKSGADGEEESTAAAAGAPPLFDIDFDPRDPAQVKVHYDLLGWGFEERAELAETLAEQGVPHAWDGDELVVPEQLEAPVDAIFEALEAELGPFRVPLARDEPATEFALDDWSPADVDSLTMSLIAAEIPHRWERQRLFVATDADNVVDDLVDAIESGEVASLDEQSVAPDGALHELHNLADRIRRDPTHSAARERLFRLVPELSPDAPPYGLPAASWASMVTAGRTLVERFESGSSADDLKEAAGELHAVCRPWV